MRTEQEINGYIKKLKENIEKNNSAIEGMKKENIDDLLIIESLQWTLQTKAEKAAEIKNPIKKMAAMQINIGDSVLVLNENYETTIINKVRSENGWDGWIYFYKDVLGETDSTNINNLEKL